MIFKKWLLKENNTQFSEIGLNDLEDAEDLLFHKESTKILIFFSLRKQSTGPLFVDDEEMLQYIDISFADLDIDWDKNPING